jgi:hypothetical protein
MAAKSPKIAFDFMPGYTPFCTANLIQIEHPGQNRMGTPEATYNDMMPAHYYPWGYPAVRIHAQAGTIKATPPFLPKQKA